MLGRRIAIGSAAVAIAIAGVSTAWVALKNTHDEAEQEGMLVNRQLLDEVTNVARKENFDCPYALQGELVEASDRGNTYRLSCGSRDDHKKPFSYRVTIRPYGQSTVEPW
jgi:hypothetical protein